MDVKFIHAEFSLFSKANMLAIKAVLLCLSFKFPSCGTDFQMDIVCASRVLWLHRPWTIQCQCSQQTWWAPWHNRWTIFRWAQQERWVEEFVLFWWVLFFFFGFLPQDEILSFHWHCQQNWLCTIDYHTFQVPVWTSCLLLAYSILGQVYSHWQCWRLYCVAFKFELLPVLETKCTKYDVCFWKSVFMRVPEKSRPCNLIHLSLFFFSQMLPTSANISFPGYFQWGANLDYD